MTATPEEKLQWKADSEAVNAFVDKMVTTVQSQGVEPVVYMAIDMVFRSYLQWIHSAQILRADPELARDSLVNSMNIVVMEAAGRLRSVDEKGVKLGYKDWVGDFIRDLVSALAEEVQKVEPAKKIIIPH